MIKIDYAGRVASYMCEHDGPLGEKLTTLMMSTMDGERPLTKEDSERWMYSIDRHVEAKLKAKRDNDSN